MNGLRPVVELGARRPHGDRLRYMAGCRCDACRGANTAYERARAQARKAGDWNGLVSADKARAHIERLKASGVGRRQISDASGVAQSIVHKVYTGARTQIRALSERAILAVTREAAADHLIVSATATWRLLDELIASGYTKALLARELGFKMGAIQIKRTTCTLRTEYRVQLLHARLRRVPYKPTATLIAELREEGYNRLRLERMLRKMADREGRRAPDLDGDPRIGFLASTAELVQRLHAELLAEEVA